MEKQTVRPAHIRRRHILARLLLSAAAVVILLPVVLTALYSFFSPGEIKAFMQTRGSFDAKSLMEIKLSPNMFSLSQYYKILIEDMTILRYFVNSAMYTAAILFGQALLIPAMAYALSRFKFRGRDALFFVVIMLMLLPCQVTMVPNVITLRAMGLSQAQADGTVRVSLGALNTMDEMDEAARHMLALYRMLRQFKRR